MNESPGTDYRGIASAAGLSAEELGLLEQLAGVARSTDPFASGLFVYSACERLRAGRMSIDAVRKVVEEQRHVDAAVRRAFRGVERTGGVSWSEAFAMDVNGSDEELAAARASDDEPTWEALVDERGWHPNNGPWPFLDAIGFHYYMAPAMVHDIRHSSTDSFEWALQTCTYHRDEVKAIMTPAQFDALGRFFGYFDTVADLWARSDDDESWRDLLRAWQPD